MIVRDCAPDDLPAVVDILEAKRAQLAAYEPRFWKQSPTSRATTKPYLAELLKSGEHVFLVAEHSSGIAGFLLASPVRVPPVYDAGPTAVIDDFHVADDAIWNDVGGALLTELRLRLRERGFVQFVFVSAHRDTAKMRFLHEQGLSEHASWFNGAI
ncbi:GNAT family N-acetyltransferase [Chelativorans sp.]|uniref:GNAT family N-acetyltransferase n=1 Tax=Chelativorans sp. TaxID=2203393 RepID=UPI0028125975|nr:GNAT family N-acetyltransferase [Chelativorans sp.]